MILHHICKKNALMITSIYIYYLIKIEGTTVDRLIYICRLTATQRNRVTCDVKVLLVSVDAWCRSKVKQELFSCCLFIAEMSERWQSELVS